MTKALITVIKQITEEQFDFSKDSNFSAVIIKENSLSTKTFRSSASSDHPTCYLILPTSQELSMVYAVLTIHGHMLLKSCFNH